MLQYFNIALFIILFTNIITIHFWLFCTTVGDWLKTIYSHTRGIGKRMIGFRNHLFSCFDKFRSFQILTFAVEKKTTSRLVQLLAGCANVLLGGLSWRRRWRGLPDCTTDIIPSGAKSAFSSVSLQQGFSTREPQWAWSRRTEFHWQLNSKQDHLRTNDVGPVIKQSS